MKPAKREIIDKFLEQGITNVIDLGAGDCSCSNYMAKRGCKVTAVDIDFQSTRNSNIDCHAGSIVKLPFPDKSFSAILASHCIEHLNNPLSALLEWRRILTDDGILCAIVPPHTPRIVGRHVFVGWSVGQLMLTLLRTGYQIKDGKFLTKDYNVAGIVRKAKDPPRIVDNDEILLQHAHLFPEMIKKQIDANHRKNVWKETISFFQGNISALNWSES